MKNVIVLLVALAVFSTGLACVNASPAPSKGAVMLALDSQDPPPPRDDKQKLPHNKPGDNHQDDNGHKPPPKDRPNDPE
ncbi:MAG: hypothetical protein GYA36_08850 [Veillonellaceae bacterium]|nr:hypothetical protein [Veillonellaceae bacterium]